MATLNLMPPESKTDIMYARRNKKMLKYCFMVLAVIAAMGVVVVFGSFYIDRSKTSLQSSIDNTNSIIVSEKLASTQKDVSSLSDGLKLIVQILQKEIRFSKLLQQIGSVIPSRTLLTSIVLSDQINNALDLQARAIDYNTATQLQINLSDPNNKLFDKVDVVSISCTPPTVSSGTLTPDSLLSLNYPCTATLRALFKKDASFLFINGPSAAKTTTGSKP